MPGKRPPLDEEKALFEATVAAEGVTTEAGEGTGLSLVDAGLASAGANSFISMLAIIYPGQPTLVDSKDVTAFNNDTGEVTVASAFKGGEVAAGVPYKIVTFRFTPAEVAAIDAKLGAFTSVQNLKAILGDLSTTKRLGQILGGLDETDTLKAILGAFTAAQNLKAILGNLTTTKNLGGILGALDTTDNLKGILGAYTTAANLKAAIDALALEATLGTHDTDIKALLATIAGYLDTEIAAILAAVDTEVASILEDTGTTIPGLLATIQADLDNPDQYKANVAALALEATLTAIKGAGWTDENLTTIDGLIDAIKTVTDNLPDSGALTALLASIASILEDTGTTLPATLATIIAYIDTEVAAILAAVDTEVASILTVVNNLPDGGALTALLASIASILEDTGTTLPATLATIAGYIDTEVAAIKAQTDKIAGKMLFSMDFWSDPQEEAQVGDAVAGATVSLPTVTVADLPTGATIVRAIAMFKFRMVDNTNAAANKLNGATVANTSQVIQVRDDTPGTWRDAINFVDDQFGIAATTREGGDVLIGSIDIAVEVDANDGYNFQWLLARADLDYLQFNDVQVGLRVLYSV